MQAQNGFFTETLLFSALRTGFFEKGVAMWLGAGKLSLWKSSVARGSHFSFKLWVISFWVEELGSAAIAAWPTQAPDRAQSACYKADSASNS